MFARHIIRAAAAASIAFTVVSAGAPAAQAVGHNSLGIVSGVAFLDQNANGVRDPGESSTFGWYKVTNGGNYFSCGFTGKGGTFGVPVKPGVFYVMPIAVKGFHTTTPVIKVDVKETGKSYSVAMGFAPNSAANGDACSQYLPKRIARDSGLGLIETATAAGKFNTLLSLVERAGLTGVLLTGGPFTLFAPTDAAFAKLTDEETNAIINDKAKLTEILRAHIVPGRVSANDVLNGVELKTLNGNVLTPKVVEDEASVNDAILIATDISTVNGIIHSIDTVIVP